MGQKGEILRMLKDAGDTGVTGNQFYAACLPRFAARIKELRDEGHSISTERIDRNHFVYRLRSAKPAISLAGTHIRGVSRDTGRAGGRIPNRSPAPSTVGSSSSGDSRNGSYQRDVVHHGHTVAARSGRSYYEMEALFDGEGAA